MLDNHTVYCICEADNEIIEATKHKELPIFTVQWHPEEIYCEITTKFVISLLEKS